MIVLGVETSCDETCVALVKDGKHVLSNVVFSQIDIHKQYGGVVPEIASRHHIEKIIYVFDQALKDANMTVDEVDLIAVTVNPGLVGSLLVGYNAAVALSIAFNKPLVEVDHIYGHIYANYLENDFEFPLLALVVSGGHTQLVVMKEHMDFTILGETLDDAVGEAYDKVARVIGVGYPGGPIIDQMATKGKPTYKLPIARLEKDSYNFSFSGLKSSVTNLVNQNKMKNIETNHNDLATSFQESVITVLVEKTLKAVHEFGIKQVVIAGGVAANKGLRLKMTDEIEKLPHVKLTIPSFKYCTDNAAMIAVGGYFYHNHK
jgi:N6-L-threonylcarbamoyladenine synthase